MPADSKNSPVSAPEPHKQAVKTLDKLYYESSTRILNEIKTTLIERGIPFKQIHHSITVNTKSTSEERGTSMKTGGKALIVKVGDAFELFVLPADRRMDMKKIRAHLGTKKITMASVGELRALTGLLPGSIPPFGHPILPLPMNLDESVAGNDVIAFNAGSLTDSIVMSVKDYVAVACIKRQFSFTEPLVAAEDMVA